ncbi:MAG: protease modulator HflC [Synergistaceae bacterium]|jgi:membrane protease subunit HflC|nr:protease modulator HflC [Synergistaceae bacterium]
MKNLTMRSLATVAVVVLFVLTLALSSIYLLYPYEISLVTRFGEVSAVQRGEGLHFKLPFVDEVTKYSSRLYEYYSDTASVITSNKQTIQVDILATFIITDPEKFYQTSRTIERAIRRLDDVTYSVMLSIAGKSTFEDIIVNNREPILSDILRSTRDQTSDYGIYIKTVQFKKVLLLAANEEQVYKSMITERERVSIQTRAEGEAESSQIRSKAEWDAASIVGEANIRAAKIKAEGDKEAQDIINRATQTNVDLYTYMKRLEMYKAGIKRGTTVIANPRDGVFKNLLAP